MNHRERKKKLENNYTNIQRIQILTKTLSCANHAGTYNACYGIGNGEP
jgi:hypothetical protein